MNRRAYKLFVVGLAIAGWIAAAATQGTLNRARAELGLTHAPPLENAPPVLAFTTVALGGFRGVIANALWIRAMEMQESGRYFELVQLADWITKLQPRNAAAWKHHAMNLGYNISRTFSDPRDRWLWVQRGIELLRDEALVYNPGSAEIYHELAWHFQHKIGLSMDDAHVYYKTQLAHEMSRLLGVDKPDYRPLIEPKTEDEQRRAAVLRNKLKLEPRRMAGIEAKYGPLEWRLPEAHAIYWADTGLERCGKTGTLKLRRVIWQSMQASVRRGRLIPVHAEGRFEWGPNLDLLPAAEAVYQQFIDESPEERGAVEPGHKFFLREAVFLLYVNNRIREARMWMDKLQQLYPDLVPPGTDLDAFALGYLGEIVKGTTVDRLQATIEGLLVNAYFSLAIGDTGRAEGMDRLAQRAWERHQAKFAGQEQRVGLPPLKALRERVLGELLAPGEGGLHPQLQAQLRTALNLPGATTNAPPQK